MLKMSTKIIVHGVLHTHTIFQLIQSTVLQEGGNCLQNSDWVQFKVMLYKTNKYCTIHFNQQLVEGVFPLVMPTKLTSPSTGSANSINLINKNYTGGILPGLGKHIPDSCGANTHKHLQKLWPWDAQEGHLSFTSHRFGQQGLTSPRRAREDGTLWQWNRDETFPPALQLYILYN